MTPAQQRRTILIISLVLGVSLGVGLVLYALSQNINLFYTPTQLATQDIDRQRSIRIGGMVVKNSVIRHDNLEVEFTLTDFNQEVKVRYRGILPDLFKEGQGIVALGTLNEDRSFKAEQVLAKHDEKYMPPEVKAALAASPAFERVNQIYENKAP